MMHAAVSIARLANTKGQRVVGCGDVFAQVMRTGLSMIRLTVRNQTVRLAPELIHPLIPRL